MNAGHVYVLAFDNGTIKVGRTQNAPKRLSSHKSSARSFGLTITDEWVSPLHVEWQVNEEALKVIAAMAGGTPTSPEYFTGTSFAAVTEKARELPFTPPEPDAPKKDDPPPLVGGVRRDSKGLVLLNNPLSKLAVKKKVDEATEDLLEFAYLLFQMGADDAAARKFDFMQLHCADILDMIRWAEKNPEAFAAA